MNEKTTITCPVCPHRCRLAPGDSGLCRVRVNRGGRVEPERYDTLCALHLDPIEKKPFYHVVPGASILSVGTPGCNLRCRGCQNAAISQSGFPEGSFSLPSEMLPGIAQEQQTDWIAYTYTEPLVSLEYVREACCLAREAGLRNALVTAAYVNPEVLETLLPYVDAANVDIKGFSDAFYREWCGGRLQPVLEAVKAMRRRGIHLEITCLMIPGMNDSDEQIAGLAEWMVAELGRDVPLHLTRFFPAWRAKDFPPTPLETLARAERVVREKGLCHVYPGNVGSESPVVTPCAACGEPLIIRRGYRVQSNRLQSGRCFRCSTPLYGIWE